ncbi:SDR family NAD(P)-dependent oxidoreductase [Acidithiobacillus montserratensis]|uniref:SDR family NAD(P)-dependent oxidoreductase n=1 Tax=Acidithiobacillus montserratensis TaxID=2729135 RepID=A0ACD5HDI7_9PROT|nr:SDR family NAD(P)-dependent oxidoreductase [Acidithiobacillus montserratensis]MBN2678658.1 SDR family NAD(P)-dependent oxidoreductase [Acidithiobacillaceae bacterium]MBU2748454.1 SDR family NAD(P)-dependent oxidoreductase [Acidithiobacillus montserratensis]
MSTSKACAVVTGASSGIGAETARQLARQGYQVYLGARRLERLQALAAEIQGVALALDVTDPESVRQFVDQLPETVDVLVNNAGGALGLEAIADMEESHWQRMWDSNVLGLARMSKALYPRLLKAASGTGHLINIGSIAAHETYAGGGGYTACKHAVKAITETLRVEWLGQPVRISQIDPGLVETEFSLVRFAGDAERAANVYAGMEPLVAADIAEAIVWVISRPAHVNIDEIIIKPRDQARAGLVHRR